MKKSTQYSAIAEPGNALSRIRYWGTSLCILAIVLTVAVPAAPSQQTSMSNSNGFVIHGTVLGASGLPVDAAKLRLQQKDSLNLQESLTDEKGSFAFSISETATYLLVAEKSGQHTSTIILPSTGPQSRKSIDLVLGHDATSSETSKRSSIEAMQFADQPSFTVAGVTDFTAAGGHGSDSSLRASEALARETTTLKQGNGTSDSEAKRASSESEDELKTAILKSPTSFEANHRLGELYLERGKYSDAVAFLQTAYQADGSNRENEYDLAIACKALGDFAHSRKYVQQLLAVKESGSLYRLAGELDESLGDSLAAVREYQKAVTLDPSEQNFFSWGSQLLLHRAIWQAQQVFEQGSKHYPDSTRMRTGLGAALFAGAAYGEAATRLCQASDLNPFDQEPYIFLGKVQIAAPDRLPGVQQRLQRFVQQQPGNAAANYLYAMALQKGHEHITSPGVSQEPETFLKDAIRIDPGYADAYLQLGILYSSRKNYDLAISFFTKAIAAAPLQSEAYYHLAVAYERVGESAKAQKEFSLHDEVARKQAAEIERQRQEVKQFLVVLSPDASHAATP